MRMESTGHATPGRSRGEAWAIWIGVALTALAYGWSLVAVNPRLADRSPLDHYAYLTDALLSGQLDLKVQPDPQLAQLANPYAGSQDIPALHDATYFGGRYYLYFGPTPVVLLLAPWHVLTRTYLIEGAATVVFSFAGFLIGAYLWVGWKRRFLPRLADYWTGFAIIMLGMGNYVFFLIQTPMVYQVPISCAYACLMASLGFVISALRSDSTSGQAHRLGLASAALGLAVGARPNYLFMLPALGLPLYGLWRQARQREGPNSPGCRLLVIWTLAPAGAIGAILAAYNWARFGDFLEFGVKYQLASMDVHEMKLTGLGYLPAGLRDLLFSAPNYFSHFPFLSESADAFGVLPWAPFALAALAFPLTLLDQERRSRLWVLCGGFLLLSCVLNFFALCLVAFRNDRYAVDFLPAAIWLGLVVMAAALTAPRRIWRLCGVLLAFAAGFTLVHSVLLALSLRPHATLAGVLNRPVAAIEGLAGVRYGPLQLDLKFPETPVVGRSEELLSMADGADVLYVDQPDEAHVQFRFFHRGVGGPSSDPIAVDRGRIHALVLDLGALYPPSEHPLFAGWPDSLVDALHRRLLISLDGKTILDRSVDYYTNDYFHTRIGTAIAIPTGENPFSGTLLNVRRATMPLRAQVAPVAIQGPIRITLRFPDFASIFGEPLISTGRSGAGDLVYVTYLGPGLVRFGHDCWNYGPAETRSVSFNPMDEQTVDVDMGSLRPGQPTSADGRTLFQLRFNGQLIASAYRPFHPSLPVDVAFGYNAIRASTASATFSGPEFRTRPIAPFAPPPPVVAAGGAVRLTVRFPTTRTGERDPLLVTGRAGGADAVYVVYDDDTHVKFGYGHTGAPSQEGPPIAVDYGFVHEVTIHTDSLGLPGARARGRVRIECDGDEALDAPGATYPAPSGQVALGSNPVGAPGCGEQFKGILSLAEQSPSF
jgi:hypothetical protein